MNLVYFSEPSSIESLFHEELGLVLEVKEADVQYVTEAYSAENISCNLIGQSEGDGPDSVVKCFSLC